MLREPKFDDVSDANDFSASADVDARGAQRPLIATESSWRKRPEPPVFADGLQARVSLSRWWSAGRDIPVEVSSDEVDDFHTLTIPLRPTRMEFTIGRKLAFRGVRQTGVIFLTGPKTQRWSGVFEKGFDHLRCYIPQSVMVECYENIHGRPPSSEISLLETGDSDDDLLAHLARALCSLESASTIYGPSFIDSLGVSIASRLLWLYGDRKSPPEPRKSAPLAKWRLAKALDYIEAHLSEPIYLTDLCEIVGLSHTHFAAQFRAATGYPPTGYIMRQRILRAQELLSDPNQAIVNVALSVGFSSQTHFTEAFKRVTGETPARWRNRIIL